MSLRIYQGHQTPSSTVPLIVNVDDWGFIVGDLEIIIGLVLLAFHLIPPNVTPLTNLAENTVQGLC